MPPRAPRAERTDSPASGYGLLDAGDGRRLERFGPRVVDRPAATAAEPRRAPSSVWAAADLRFDPATGWVGGPEMLEPWPVSIHGLTMELRPTTSGAVGLYPEHAQGIDWVGDRIRERSRGGPSPLVLNLFAHSGLLTLAAARAGASVVHVDSARTAVARARRNAELSGLADRPIRWLVDDATSFVSREIRRGRRYDGLILDPPSFGHAKGRRWRLEDELPDLLASCRRIATDDAFLLLSAHTSGLDAADLVAFSRAAFGGARIDVGGLGLTAASGAHLDLGLSVRRAG
jgi:23S rRNA (cytosine1962-C5)-methyltransferase